MQPRKANSQLCRSLCKLACIQPNEESGTYIWISKNSSIDYHIVDCEIRYRCEVTDKGLQDIGQPRVHAH